ncbi:hypothetical protein CLV67_1331, partial [Actinoplanes italicus]
MRRDWERVKDDVMRRAVTAKFTARADIRESGHGPRGWCLASGEPSSGSERHRDPVPVDFTRTAASSEHLVRVGVAYHPPHPHHRSYSSCSGKASGCGSPVRPASAVATSCKVAFT